MLKKLLTYSQVISLPLPGPPPRIPAAARYIYYYEQQGGQFWIVTGGQFWVDKPRVVRIVVCPVLLPVTSNTFQ